MTKCCHTVPISTVSTIEILNLIFGYIFSYFTTEAHGRRWEENKVAELAALFYLDPEIEEHYTTDFLLLLREAGKKAKQGAFGYFAS